MRLSKAIYLVPAKKSFDDGFVMVVPICDKNQVFVIERAVAGGMAMAIYSKPMSVYSSVYPLV